MLIKKRNNGEQAWAAFEAEAMPHADRLFRLAMWLERNRDEAEDLVQETLTQALQFRRRPNRGTSAASPREKYCRDRMGRTGSAPYCVVATGVRRAASV